MFNLTNDAFGTEKGEYYKVHNFLRPVTPPFPNR